MVTITNMINYNLVLKKNADVHRYIMMYDA